MNERWIMVSAGRGPRECQWVVERLLPVLCKEAGGAEPVGAGCRRGRG